MSDSPEPEKTEPEDAEAKPSPAERFEETLLAPPTQDVLRQLEQPAKKEWLVELVNVPNHVDIRRHRVPPSRTDVVARGRLRTRYAVCRRRA